jgi:hypothetical protein
VSFDTPLSEYDDVREELDDSGKLDRLYELAEEVFGLDMNNANDRQEADEFVDEFIIQYIETNHSFHDTYAYLADEYGMDHDHFAYLENYLTEGE